MKSIIQLFLYLSLVLLLGGCDAGSDLNNSSFDYAVPTEISVKNSATSIERDYIIRFDSVLSDSRCPKGAECFWVGVAGIRLTVWNRTALPKTVDLYTFNNREWADSAVYKNIKIKLLALNPYPSVNAKFAYSAYKAKLKVTKNN